MNAEIEDLRKFTNGTVSKARVKLLQNALSNARALFLRLEPKPEDPDAAADFENTQSELETALDELDSACGELESAEDKDERVDAQDHISNTLDEVMTYFNEIMPNAILGNSENAELFAECKAILAKANSLPMDQRPSVFQPWLNSPPTQEERDKRMKCLIRLMELRK